MGLKYPYEEINILNGGFDDDSHWIVRGVWSIAGGLLICDQWGVGHQWPFQQWLPFIIGHIYIINFTLLNSDFDNPDAGIIVTAGSGASSIIKTDGDHHAVCVCTANTFEVSFHIEHVSLNDYCEIDDVSCTTPILYPINTLEMTMPNNLLCDMAQAQATDYWARYASLNGKSKILISWNVP